MKKKNVLIIVILIVLYVYACIDAKDASAVTIIEQPKKMSWDVEELAETEYDYIMKDEYGNSTDMDIDTLSYALEQCYMKGIEPHLLFTIISVESGVHEDAQNPNSTAKGYCQIIESTGKSMYKRLGYDSKYNHSTMALDGKLNIEMGVELLSYLMDRYDGDLRKTINAYSGNWKNDKAWDAITYPLYDNGSSVGEVERFYQQRTAEFID